MKETQANNAVVLDDYTQMLVNAVTPIKEEEVVNGIVSAITGTQVFVDLGPIGTGIIYGVEYINARDIIKKINIGDTISAKVILKENPDGYIDLSLKEALQAMTWSNADRAMTENKVFELVVKDANKGGLIIDWNGIAGFLPASQLKGEHYPKVSDGNKEEISKELKKLIGQRLPVTIIAAIPKESKLIFTESTESASPITTNNTEFESSTSKLSAKTKKKYSKAIDIISQYNLGDIVEGTVTGIVDFGIFVKINNEVEALVHKSEIDWGLVEDTKNYAKIGDTIKVEIIEIKDGKISLSMKKLKENPWLAAGKKYKKGDLVDGVVIRFNKHGALVSIEEGVAGLIHISDFKDEVELKEKLSLGKIFKFEITIFDAEEEKMTLSLRK